MHIINTSNCTLYIVKFFTGFDTVFWWISVDFQYEAERHEGNFYGIVINNLKPY